MKISIVSPYSWAHPGGVNNHVEGLSSELSKRGHEVTVFAPDRGEPPEGASFVSTGRSVPVPANGSIARLSLLPGAGSRLKRILREGQFEVVHVHEPLVPFVSTSAVMGAPCRVVGTFHAAGEGRSVQYALARALLPRVHSRLDRLVAVSEPARALASRYFPGEYEIIPNGFDSGRFTPGMPVPPGFPGGGSPVVLFVGRNEPRKGLGVLLGAFESVARRVDGCRLVVAGSGFDSESVMNSASPGLRDSITVAGYVSNEELPAYYAAADLFCAPALGGESFGIVLLESNACGTPVVASDIPGYSAVVRQTGGGVLFKRGDPESLAAALIDLLADDRKRRKLAEAGLENVQEYSWERLAGRLESVYAD